MSTAAYPVARTPSASLLALLHNEQQALVALLRPFFLQNKYIVYMLEKQSLVHTETWVCLEMDYAARRHTSEKDVAHTARSKSLWESKIRIHFCSGKTDESATVHWSSSIAIVHVPTGETIKNRFHFGGGTRNVKKTGETDCKESQKQIKDKELKRAMIVYNTCALAP